MMTIGDSEGQFFYPILTRRTNSFSCSPLNTSIIFGKKLEKDLSTIYTTLPHNLIKDKLVDLIERTFQREGSPYLACNDRNAFFTSEKQSNL